MNMCHRPIRACRPGLRRLGFRFAPPGSPDRLALKEIQAKSTLESASLPRTVPPVATFGPFDFWTFGLFSCQDQQKGPKPLTRLRAFFLNTPTGTRTPVSRMRT